MTKEIKNGFRPISFKLLQTGIFFLALLANSCIYQKEVQPKENQFCVEKNVSYQAQIQPMLQKYCLDCHSNVQHSGGIKLEYFSDVKAEAVSGELYDSIISFNGRPAKMPKGSVQLSDCQVNTIKTWITEGLKNN